VDCLNVLVLVVPGMRVVNSLAVYLFELAGWGSCPLAFTLALSLPRADAAWTEAFAGGLLALADAHGCELVGGDTTQGPLNICITVFGEVPPGQALLRSGARAGDDIWVSGSLGDARLALEALLGHTTLPPGTLAAARQRLEAPTPRVALGQALRGIASSALDVSDGLLGDLGHILEQSRVGASLDTRMITPLLDAGRHTPLAIDLLHQCTLSGGDDYELCFTAPADRRDAVQAAGRDSATRVTRIGCIEEQPGLRLIGPDGAAMAPRWTSFDHFAAA
jgi:thiamine-monophosphate kinase